MNLMRVFIFFILGLGSVLGFEEPALLGKNLECKRLIPPPSEEAEVTAQKVWNNQLLCLSPRELSLPISISTALPILGEFTGEKLLGLNFSGQKASAYCRCLKKFDSNSEEDQTRYSELVEQLEGRLVPWLFEKEFLEYGDPQWKEYIKTSKKRTLKSIAAKVVGLSIKDPREYACREQAWDKFWQNPPAKCSNSRDSSWHKAMSNNFSKKKGRAQCPKDFPQVHLTQRLNQLCQLYGRPEVVKTFLEKNTQTSKDVFRLMTDGPFADQKEDVQLNADIIYCQAFSDNGKLTKGPEKKLAGSFIDPQRFKAAFGGAKKQGARVKGFFARIMKLKKTEEELKVARNEEEPDEKKIQQLVDTKMATVKDLISDYQVIKKSPQHPDSKVDTDRKILAESSDILTYLEKEHSIGNEFERPENILLISGSDSPDKPSEKVGKRDWKKEFAEVEKKTLADIDKAQGPIFLPPTNRGQRDWLSGLFTEGPVDAPQATEKIAEQKPAPAKKKKRPSPPKPIDQPSIVNEAPKVSAVETMNEPIAKPVELPDLSEQVLSPLAAPPLQAPLPQLVGAKVAADAKPDVVKENTSSGKRASQTPRAVNDGYFQAKLDRLEIQNRNLQRKIDKRFSASSEVYFGNPDRPFAQSFQTSSGQKRVEPRDENINQYSLNTPYRQPQRRPTSVSKPKEQPKGEGAGTKPIAGPNKKRTYTPPIDVRNSEITEDTAPNTKRSLVQTPKTNNYEIERVVRRIAASRQNQIGQRSPAIIATQNENMKLLPSEEKEMTSLLSDLGITGSLDEVDTQAALILIKKLKAAGLKKQALFVSSYVPNAICGEDLIPYGDIGEDELDPSLINDPDAITISYFNDFYPNSPALPDLSPREPKDKNYLCAATE